MYIYKLCIRNFRNFVNSELNLSKGVNTFVGENGSGKTNIFEAMRLLLDDSLSGRERKLQKEDFSRVLGDWKGHWISIQAFFDEIGDSELDRILTYSASSLQDPTKGSYTYIFRPKKEVRRKLFELTKKGVLQETKDYLYTVSINDYEYQLICRSSVNLASDEHYKTYVGDFEKLIFPDPDDMVYDEIWGNKNSNFTVFEHTSFTFVKALRDAVRELRYSKNSPLKYLFEDLNSGVSEDSLNSIGTKVNELNRTLSSLAPIQEFTTDITKTLESSVGNSYSPKIEVKSELPADMTSLLRSLALWVGDPSDDHLGYLDDLSLGGANLVYLSIKLLEYERKKSKDKIIHFLVIEEPEAHIHTHIQRSLFANLNENIAQVFVSTHSTNLSSTSKISTMNILSSLKNQSEVYFPTSKLNPIQVKKIERYLDAVRSNLLFAKGVVLVEGDAEEILIPVMFKKCLGISLDEMGVSIVNIGSTGFENVATLFDKDRIKKRCSILTDSDKAIVDDTYSDKDFFAKQKRSEVAGTARKSKLELIFFDNKYVSLNFAAHTFEVDIVKEARNDAFFKLLADNIYSKGLPGIKSELDSNDISVKGKRALMMAENVGKGWFALELAEAITIDFEIPQYIIEAVAFACSGIDVKKVIGKSVEHLAKGRPIIKQTDLNAKDSMYKMIWGDDNIIRFNKALSK